MNQHDHMREQEYCLLNRLRQNYAWLIRDGFTTSANNLDEAIFEITKLSERVKELKYALAHVNETPKNEHDSDDVLKRAPLVRLTDEVLINIYLASKAEWKATNKRQRQRIAVVFGSAIMDAMERVNGRKV